MNSMHQVYLSLGSNIGDREKHLMDALKEIEIKLGHIKKCSSVYETEAWGFESDTSFFNLVVLIETKLDLLPFFNEMQELELKLGRIQKSKNANYEDRTIDIDIIFFDQEIYQTADLNIPHLQYDKRNFVLFPLVEISPDFHCPKYDKQLSEILIGKRNENFDKIKKNHKR